MELNMQNQQEDCQQKRPQYQQHVSKTKFCSGFDLSLLRESLADVERTAQERLRGGNVASNWNDLFTASTVSCKDETSTNKSNNNSTSEFGII